MIIGTTTNLIMPCELDMTAIDDIYIYLQTDNRLLTKSGSIVTYDAENKELKAPIYQQDTIDLSQNEPCLCKVQVQINYADKSISKSKIATFKLESTLSNTTVLDNEPRAEQRITIQIQI